MSERAREAFQAFHSRNAGVPVFPFEELDVGEFPIPVGLPDMVLLGRAVRTCYTSDKWNAPGKTVGYFHDHGPGDGPEALTAKNKVKFYAPSDFFPKQSVVDLPVEWPDALTLLGTCDEWLVQKNLGDELFIEGECEDDILLCSPFGWVDENDPERAFLVIIEVSTGYVEGLIAGPGLRVTAAGITG